MEGEPEVPILEASKGALGTPKRRSVYRNQRADCRLLGHRWLRRRQGDPRKLQIFVLNADLFELAWFSWSLARDTIHRFCSGLAKRVFLSYDWKSFGALQSADRGISSVVRAKPFSFPSPFAPYWIVTFVVFDVIPAAVTVIFTEPAPANDLGRITLTWSRPSVVPCGPAYSAGMLCPFTLTVTPPVPAARSPVPNNSSTS